MRLVYTVDVDEAIKDKRDRFYEDMRNELAKLYGVRKGDERPTEQELEALRKLVEVDAPRNATDTVVFRVKEGADPSKIDARFLQNFSGDMSYSRSGDQRTLTFRLREKAKSSIRDRAVGQAREIILRRVDGCATERCLVGGQSAEDPLNSVHHRLTQHGNRAAFLTEGTSVPVEFVEGEPVGVTLPDVIRPVTG